MAVKQTAIKQYQWIADRARAQFGGHFSTLPSEGWIATARKALGMSGSQLAKRLGVTRARVSQAERSELGGGVTLKAMRTAAEAMGCRFVYAIIPEQEVETLIAAQARRKAREIVGRAGTHMALEAQSLPEERNAEEVERLAQDLIRDMPPDFWERE